ncbi:MAG: molybdenum cofactor guanylyltransferase, partial [Bacteroidales bacterium]|nr:molybdenum cofactor guanylyltransferase [Bacteroidales bacterium]
MLPVRGVPIIQHVVRQLESHFTEIIIGGAEDKYGFLGHRVVPDAMEEMGPLMGIYSCLTASGDDLNFITACDIPDINFGFVGSMLGLSEGADIVVPINGVGDYEPLHAIYRKSVIPLADKLLKEKKLKISDLARIVKTRLIPFDGTGWYRNLNTRDDYASYTGI